MKRILSIMLVAVLCISFASCSTNEEEKTISRGTINGNVYTSDYLELSFTKPDSWTYSSDEQIASVMSSGLDILDANTFEEKAAELVSIYDMMVMDSLTGNNISVSYENLKMSLSTDLSEEEYMDAVMEKLETQNSMEYESEGTTTITLGKNEFYKYTATVEYSNITCDQTYYVRKIGSYMAIIVVTIMDGSDISTIEAMFS